MIKNNSIIFKYKIDYRYYIIFKSMFLNIALSIVFTSIIVLYARPFTFSIFIFNFNFQSTVQIAPANGKKYVVLRLHILQFFT